MQVAETGGVAPLDASRLDRELAGLDALELLHTTPIAPLARLWRATWPKLAAAAVALVAWQLVVWSGWKPDYVLPGPGPVLRHVWHDIVDGRLPRATALSLRRAVTGFGLAVVIGGVIGLAVASIRVLRIAIGSLLTGLQTMPSIAWFPLAILLFRVSESAILFVVVLGAAPSIANGLIAGVDTMPPLLDRVGRVLGATGMQRYRHVVLPAAMPSIVTGLKQGWAFAWRSLMAGELIVIIANRPSMGSLLQNARDLSDSEWLLATMIAILVVGICVDSVFGAAERSLLRSRGLGAA